MDKGVNAKGISSDEKSGFVAYVDEIRKDKEKKERRKRKVASEPDAMET